MRVDNTAYLITAARRRHEFTRAKAIRALRELDQAGAPITFEAVARAAEVSRSWLYAQAEFKNEIQKLRALAGRAPSQPIPSRQRATDASLRQRLEIAISRNQQLAEENRRLRRQLELALGRLRADGLGAPGPKP